MKTDRSKYPLNSGFDVPENYFKNLEDRIIQRMEAKEINLPERKAGFNVPDGYFGTLEDRLMEKAGQKETKVIEIYRKEYFYYAAAVAAILILTLGNFFQTATNENIGWDDVEISTIENYIDEGYEMGYIELNTADYSEFIFEDGQLIGEEDFNTVNAEAAMEYIDENLEDPSYIMD